MMAFGPGICLFDEKWITQDGRIIPVGKLTEPHMRNILRMLVRKRRERRARLLDGDEVSYRTRPHDEQMEDCFRW